MLCKFEKTKKLLGGGDNTNHIAKFCNVPSYSEKMGIKLEGNL